MEDLRLPARLAGSVSSVPSRYHEEVTLLLRSSGMETLELWTAVFVRADGKFSEPSV